MKRGPEDDDGHSEPRRKHGGGLLPPPGMSVLPSGTLFAPLSGLSVTNLS